MTIAHSSKTYHTNYYANHSLFEKGSWLEQCEPEILNFVNNNVNDSRKVRILDLGCGIGKNAIPLALALRKNAEITCVDVLPEAIRSLTMNARKYTVSKYIQSFVSPVETFQIPSDSYDLILANSVLMFLDNKNVVMDVLQRMKIGTKISGINYISLSCDVAEKSIKTNQNRTVTTEIPFPLEATQQWLHSFYSDWSMILGKMTPYTEVYKKEGEEVLWTAVFLSVAYQNK